ncbi:MAG: hypothetical protein QM496_13065 [Verrucomicrobiota bacterium]
MQQDRAKPEACLAMVTALMPEARPLIDHFRLQKIKGRSPFPIFRSEDGRHCLVVSGMGKILSASATTSLYHEMGELPGMAWLNIGIAGHRTRELGDLRWVNKIEDAASGQKWYPPRWIKTGSRQASALLTVDQAGEYPGGDTLVDMEASGFYQIASRFSSRELVQCVKLVSDNAENSWKDLKKGQVGLWIRAQLDDIVAGSEELLVLSGDEMKRCRLPREAEQMLDLWHFTQTEKHQLFKILRQRQVLASEQDKAVLFCQNNGVRSAKEILPLLRQELAGKGDESIMKI